MLLILGWSPTLPVLRLLRVDLVTERAITTRMPCRQTIGDHLLLPTVAYAAHCCIGGRSLYCVQFKQMSFALGLTLSANDAVCVGPNARGRLEARSSAMLFVQEQP